MRNSGARPPGGASDGIESFACETPQSGRSSSAGVVGGAAGGGAGTSGGGTG